jgi:hypothetical protein
MSIFQRITNLQSTQVTVIKPGTSPRFRYPNGVFAALRTTPEPAADVAYDAFRAQHLTPGVAEREVAKILSGTNPVCLPVESSPGYAHESNQQQLRALREIHHARRLRIMPGCCEVCDQIANRSWRVSDPPDLPVRGCLRHGGCRCSYVPDIN